VLTERDDDVSIAANCGWSEEYAPSSSFVIKNVREKSMQWIRSLHATWVVLLEGERFARMTLDETMIGRSELYVY
jgi:hypothetical protein